MNDNICRGLSFKSEKMTFNVCYSPGNKYPDRLSIKGIIKPSNRGTYAYFQFYKEIFSGKKCEDKWIIDKSKAEDAPYYGISDSWSYKWSDAPKYNLDSKGKILFNTFVAEVEKGQQNSPKTWTYKVILGFSWGMVSKDGNKIEKISIQNMDRSILKEFVDSLHCEYSKANFEIANNLIEGNNSDISEMW